MDIGTGRTPTTDVGVLFFSCMLSGRIFAEVCRMAFILPNLAYKMKSWLINLKLGL